MGTLTETTWHEQSAALLTALTPLLSQRGFSLASKQPHLGGERFLMQAITTQSGQKLILYGTKENTGQAVVIKAACDPDGVAELAHERACRTFLNRIAFAAKVFHTPTEIAYFTAGGYTVSIQAYIEQTSSFIERPLAEQFTYALAAFKAQEGAHATTAKHFRQISRRYELRPSTTYLKNFASFSQSANTLAPNDTALHASYQAVMNTLIEQQTTIERYSNFLTHTDFVPHNFRINPSGTMYLLDYSAVAFGNKYEGWARFINFMTLYNPPLATALETYVADNRSPGEVEALALMRLYRLGEIICYYLTTLERSSGDLHTLNQTRVDFWHTILTHCLNQEPVPASVISDYQATRDQLRSTSEKQRQHGLH